MARLEPPAARALVLAMAVTASLTMEVALNEGPRWLPPFWSAVTALPAAAVVWRLRHTGVARPGSIVQGLLLAILIAPVLWDPLARVLFHAGAPPHVLLLIGLRNLVLGLAALGGNAHCARLAAVASGCVVVFAYSMNAEPAVTAAVGAFVLLSTTWLAHHAWQASTGSAELPLPLIPTAGAILSIALVFGFAATATAHSIGYLKGFVPTSGGAGSSLAFARGGVSEGDDEVGAREDAQSLGYAESDIYLDSPEPTLYDAFNDLYGQPDPRRTFQRAIGLQSAQVREPKSRPSRNYEARKEFSTARQQPRATGTPRERDASALFYVSGHLPAHLRTTAYDLFDGVVWREAMEVRPKELPFAVQSLLGENWIRHIATRLPNVYGGSRRHTVRIGRIQTNRLPLPMEVERVRVEKVDRPDFFAWAQSGILRMDVRQVPAGTVVQVESRLPDPRRLRYWHFPPEQEVAPRRYASPYEAELSPAIASLARRWAGDLPRGWVQIEAVVRSLRAHCHHAPAPVQPGEVRNTVEHFLFHSRCGPDYMFASAAALLLRSLGYPCRLTAGYYAHQRNLDPRTQMAAVREQDVHFWAEVLLGSSPGRPWDLIWAPIEPTPGFELARPAPTAWETVIARLEELRNRVQRNAFWLAGVMGVVALAVRRRSTLLDMLVMALWRAWPTSNAQIVVHGAIRILELRARLAGVPRPAGVTLRRWYLRLCPRAQADMETLFALADRVQFGSPGLVGIPLPAVRRHCETALNAAPLNTLIPVRGRMVRSASGQARALLGAGLALTYGNWTLGQSRVRTHQ